MPSGMKALRVRFASVYEKPDHIMERVEEKLRDGLDSASKGHRRREVEQCEDGVSGWFHRVCNV